MTHFLISYSSHGNYDSQNSTKTLASSDMESGNPAKHGLSSDDGFGFARSAETQQERLQKRNDNIKRNLSFKSEEAKNKRPSKLSKSKSKSKSSIDQLSTDNSSSAKSKTEKESNKKKQSADKKKTDAATGSKKQVDANQADDEKPSASKKSAKAKSEEAAHPADAKSETNLLALD